MAGAIAIAPVAAAQQFAPAAGAAAHGMTLRGATPPAEACLAALPARAMTRVPVYVEAVARDSLPAAVLATADLLAELVAARIRGFLGTTPNALPAGDPTVSWRTAGGAVPVTLYRDGRFAWSATTTGRDTARHTADAGPAAKAVGLFAGGDLLVRALADLRDAGERVFWQDGVAPESLTVRLVLRRPTVRPEGTLEPLRARFAVPAFSVTAPSEQPVSVLQPPRISYPDMPRRGNAQGTVILGFVVDTAGRADLSTLSDEWPAGRPRPTGELGAHYRAFLAAARRGLTEARFTPANVGGCVIRQRVQYPFVFQLSQ